jgi:dihydroflavonol-4-reductase
LPRGEGCRSHRAAQISAIAGRKQAIFANNVLGTRNLLAAALQHRVRRVVVTNSLSAVGHRIGGPADETEPFDPFDEHLPYAVSKAAVEHECLKAVADGLDVVIAISCAIVGPNDFKPSRMGQVLIDYSSKVTSWRCVAAAAATVTSSAANSCRSMRSSMSIATLPAGQSRYDCRPR